MTTEKKIYAGAKGVTVTLGVGQDLTLSTKREILVQKPDGSEVKWVAEIATEREDPETGDMVPLTPVDGYLEYITDDDDLDLAGDYALQSYVEWGSASNHLGKTVMMEVHQKFT